MSILLWILFLAPPCITLVYGTFEYVGIIDKITGRNYACMALDRLRSTKGYPETWIYDDESDEPYFKAIEIRISKHVRPGKLRRTLDDGHRPSCITTAGQPIALTGVPPDWHQEDLHVWLPNSPVMYLFGVSRDGGKGKGERACSLADLDKWLEKEKQQYRFYVGVLALGTISTALIVMRLSLA